MNKKTGLSRKLPFSGILSRVLEPKARQKIAWPVRARREM
jgi:hypothetical protein